MSKIGLGAEYEEDYKEKVLHYERTTEESTVKAEIESRMGQLMGKLNSLCNFNYSPSLPEQPKEVLLEYRSQAFQRLNVKRKFHSN